MLEFIIKLCHKYNCTVNIRHSSDGVMTIEVHGITDYSTSISDDISVESKKGVIEDAFRRANNVNT